MKLYRNIFCLFTFFVSSAVYGQAEVEMADTMRAEGKIYVVVGIILIVLVGLIMYLFLLDKKVKRLEDRILEKQTQTK